MQLTPLTKWWSYSLPIDEIDEMVQYLMIHNKAVWCKILGGNSQHVIINGGKIPPINPLYNPSHPFSVCARERDHCSWLDSIFFGLLCQMDEMYIYIYTFVYIREEDEGISIINKFLASHVLLAWHFPSNFLIPC